MDDSYTEALVDELWDYQPLPAPVPITDQEWPVGTCPLVSVRCLTYNHVNFIRDALEGFLMQATTFPVEIFVHDDASTDGTSTVLQEYEREFPEVFKVFRRKENAFRQADWHRLVEQFFAHMKGKYVAYCEGDDYWIEKNKLEIQVAFLQQNPRCAGSFHETAMVHGGVKQPRVYGLQEKEFLGTSDTIARSAPFHTSSFLARRDALPDLSALPRVFSADMRLFSMASANGPLWKAPGVLSVYRKHDAGITATKRAKERFHIDRIELIWWLHKFHKYRYKNKVYRTIYHHARGALKTVTKRKARQTLGAIRKVIERSKYSGRNR